jgi:thiamin-phosphate kinase
MNKEFEFVNKLIADYPRISNQLNQPFNSDAEILFHDGKYICISVDTISEEISMGLIRDPKSLGWLTVTASVSDLAAIGVATEQVSVTVCRPTNLPEAALQLFREGVKEACDSFNCVLAEFETVTGSEHLTTCAALAVVNERPILQRTPLRTGDLIYCTGPLGWGNAVAFANLAVRPAQPLLADQMDQSYRPIPRFKEALFLKQWAGGACIDTSDGGLFTFALLSQINDCGIEIFYSQELLHPLALGLAKQTKINPWLFFAAQNGEFELLFSIPNTKEVEFQNAATALSLPFIKVGQVVSRRGLSLKTSSTSISLDLAPIENLLYDMTAPEQYILALSKFAESNKIQT